MTFIDCEDRKEYNWRDVYYPCFYPVEDFNNPGTYYVELCVMCYPNARGTGFDIAAYPESLRKMAWNPHEAPTQFFFEMDDGQGESYENLSFEEASFYADNFNNAYHDLIKEASDTWQWERLPFDLGELLLVGSK